MKQRLLEPEYLVDVKQVEGLGEIRSEETELHLGAGVTLAEIQKSPAVQE